MSKTPEYSLENIQLLLGELYSSSVQNEIINLECPTEEHNCWNVAQFVMTL